MERDVWCLCMSNAVFDVWREDEGGAAEDMATSLKGPVYVGKKVSF